MYGGVYHVANLGETSNPHYVLREFLVHSVEEVRGEEMERGMGRGQGGILCSMKGEEGRGNIV